jgi:hypothetical protein
LVGIGQQGCGLKAEVILRREGWSYGVYNVGCELASQDGEAVGGDTYFREDAHLEKEVEFLVEAQELGSREDSSALLDRGVVAGVVIAIIFDLFCEGVVVGDEPGRVGVVLLC